MVIEDEKKIAEAISKWLRSNSYAVDIAKDGLSGEELGSLNEYDLIILDIMLPKQDGWQTCINLRKNKIQTPILMLTALGDATDKIHGLDLGADDYLVKPFHSGELLARIRSLTRRRSEMKSAIIEKFGLILNQSTHKAIRNDQEITLTTKEYGLLELLMTNANRIVSREMISEHLWDMNFDPKSNVVEAAVKFLRQKIDRGFEKPLIHTIRGAGYLFAEEKP